MTTSFLDHVNKKKINKIIHFFLPSSTLKSVRGDYPFDKRITLLICIIPASNIFFSLTAAALAMRILFLKIFNSSCISWLLRIIQHPVVSFIS